jgi:hypothetical protein
MVQQLTNRNSLLWIHNQHLLKHVNQVIGEKSLSILRNGLSQISRFVQIWILNIVNQKIKILGCKRKTVFVMSLHQLLNTYQRSNRFKVIFLTILKKRLFIGEKRPHDNTQRPYINGRSCIRRSHQLLW